MTKEWNTVYWGYMLKSHYIPCLLPLRFFSRVKCECWLLADNRMLVLCHSCLYPTVQWIRSVNSYTIPDIRCRQTVRVRRWNELECIRWFVDCCVARKVDTDCQKYCSHDGLLDLQYSERADLLNCVFNFRRITYCGTGMYYSRE